MLKVNRATGLDEISAEAMRFIRSHDHEETVDYRSDCLKPWPSSLTG